MRALLFYTASLLLVLAGCSDPSPDPRAAGADPGRTTEPLYQWSTEDGPLPTLIDVTAEWGLTGYANESDGLVAGGVALGDLDGDGHLDLVVAGGDVDLFFGPPEGMGSRSLEMKLGPGSAASVALGDLDGDGALDILIGTFASDDLVVWGGPWTVARNLSMAETTTLAGGNETVALIAAELSGDDATDVVRLSHDIADPDLVWVQFAPRSFEPVALPVSHRASLAGEIIDLDDDGLLDVWVTRDTGWVTGPDSVYTRREGSWVDIAADIGAALEVDGMGLALADFDADGDIDAYITDVGENDLLLATPAGFVPATGSGAGRIRPPDASAAVVSSSWAVATADINLDGNLDVVVANGGFGGADVVNKVPGTRFVDLDSPALFLGTSGGRYVDVWPDVAPGWTARIRSMALGDLDGDGDADIVFSSLDDGLRVYRNDTPGASVTVSADDPGCAAGYLIDLSGPSTRFRATLAQTTFLGATAPSVSVGTLGFGVRVTVLRPGLPAIERAVPAGQNRSVVTVPCDK